MACDDRLNTPYASEEMTWTASMRMSSFEPCGSLVLCAVWFRQLTSLRVVSQHTYTYVYSKLTGE